MCVCVYFCKQLPSNQSFLISKYLAARRVVVSVGGVNAWVRKATAYKFDTCTLIGVHSTMHLVDLIKVLVSYTCMCVRGCVCVCVQVRRMAQYSVCISCLYCGLPQRRVLMPVFLIWLVPIDF